MLRQACGEQIPVLFALFVMKEEALGEFELFAEQAAGNAAMVARRRASVESDEQLSTGLAVFVPLLSRLVMDRNGPVRAAAGRALVDVATYLDAAQLRSAVVPLVRKLARDTVEEEHRAEAAVLLHALAPLLGPQLCSELAWPLVRRLARDVVFSVRKAVAEHMGALWRECGGVTHTGGATAMELFERLASDDVWAVRRSCADALARLAALVPLANRVTLAAQLQRLLNDPSRWVRRAAQRQIGALIACLASADNQPAPSLASTPPRSPKSLTDTDNSTTNTTDQNSENLLNNSAKETESKKYFDFRSFLKTFVLN